MNKKIFLKTLKKELRPLKPSERKKTISYYEESIADMMESGLSEEDVIEKIGSPQKTAQEILENTSPENLRGKDVPGTVLVCASILFIILSVISGIRQHIIIESASISIIGGADGPTSIFLAGTIAPPRIWGVALFIVLITVIYKFFRAHRKKRS